MKFFIRHSSSLTLFALAGFTIASLAVPASGILSHSAAAATTPAVTVNDLDMTGNTIPDTNYTIPAGAIFMATTGSDSNAGTVGAPVKTLNAAVSKVPAGGYIIVRGGTYRDWYHTASGGIATLNKTVNINAYPHEQPWFDGTDVTSTSSWASAGSGRYSKNWDTPSFCGGSYYSQPYGAQLSTNKGPCTHVDMSKDPGNLAAGDPQMTYIDGAYIHEVTSLDQVTATSFYYDQTAKKMYIGINPSGHTVELAARPMAISNNAPDFGLRGIGFKRYASNEYSNVTAGAVYSSGNGAHIVSTVFKQMAGQALGVTPKNAIVRHSVFVDNGFNGMGSNGHQHSTGEADGLLIDHNIFARNNRELYGTGCSQSCAAAGVKIAHMDGFTVKDNIFQDNKGIASGFWCDLACTKGVMVNNIAKNNGGTGIFYEVSSTGIIASNLVIGNGKYGIRVGSASTKVYNNTMVNNTAINLWVYDDNRSYGVGGWTDVGPDTKDISVANNILYGSVLTPFKAQRTSNTALNTGPSQFFSKLDYNSYYREKGAGGILYGWKDSTTAEFYYRSVASMTAGTGFDSHSSDVTTGGDPYFTNQAAGNYTVRSGSVAYKNGTSIPSDVASAAGVSSASEQSRGALTYPTVR